MKEIFEIIGRIYNILEQIDHEENIAMIEAKENGQLNIPIPIRNIKIGTNLLKYHLESLEAQIDEFAHKKLQRP